MKKALNKALEVICAVILVVMVAVVLWQVFSRAVLKSPNTVTEEFVRFALVWVAMLASALVVGQNGHLAVTMLSEKLSGGKEKILNIVVQILFILFAILIMVYGGANAVKLTMAQISPSLGIPMGYVYLSIPVSGVLIIIYSCINLLETIQGKTVKEG